MLQGLFAKAKAKHIAVPGFPDFTGAMQDLAKVHSVEAKSDYEYQVTVPLGSDLVVLQALVAKFKDSSLTAEFQKAVEVHDAEFNKEHKQASPGRGAQDVKTEAARSPKKLTKTYETVEEFLEKHKQSPELHYVV